MRQKPSQAEVDRQVAATRARKRTVLPKSWWDVEVQERMCQWLKIQEDLAKAA